MVSRAWAKGGKTGMQTHTDLPWSGLIPAEPAKGGLKSAAGGLLGGITPVGEWGGRACTAGSHAGKGFSPAWKTPKIPTVHRIDVNQC